MLFVARMMTMHVLIVKAFGVNGAALIRLISEIHPL